MSSPEDLEAQKSWEKAEEDQEAEKKWEKAEEDKEAETNWEKAEDKEAEKTSVKAEEDKEAEKNWAEVEEVKNGSSAEIETKESETTEQGKPQRYLLHKFGCLMCAITTFAALCMGISQIVGIIFTDVGVVQIVLRLYVIIFCGVIILVEMEWTKFARESYILHNWWARGMIYNFVGVIGLEEIESQVFNNIEIGGVNPAEVYIKVIAWMMICVGLLYFVMGLFCIQHLYERQREDFTERKARSVLEAAGTPVSEQP